MGGLLGGRFRGGVLEEGVEERGRICGVMI